MKFPALLPVKIFPPDVTARWWQVEQVQAWQSKRDLSTRAVTVPRRPCVPFTAKQREGRGFLNDAPARTNLGRT